MAKTIVKTYGRISDITLTGVKDPIQDEDTKEITGYAELVKVDGTICQIDVDDKGVKNNSAQANFSFKLGKSAFDAMAEADFMAKIIAKGRTRLPDLDPAAEVMFLAGS